MTSDVFAGASEESTVRAVISSSATSAKKSLNNSGNYFSCRVKPLLRSQERVSHQIDQVCRQMPLLEKAAIELLSQNGEIRNTFYLPEWGAVYANLPKLAKQENVVDQNSSPYILALLFVRRYDEAAENALKVLAKKTDDYGAVILLGLLSTRKQEYFPYLEKAFAINPQKSIRIVDWHCDNLDMLYKLSAEWDFINAYVRLLLKYRHVFKDQRIPQLTAARLLGAIRERYFDEKYRVLPENEEISKELYELERFLIPSLEPTQDMPPIIIINEIGHSEK